jgi:hypothetical protein
MINMQLIRYVPDTKLLNLNNRILIADTASLKTDYIICATGYRPHLKILDSLSLKYNNTKYYPEITPQGESVQVKNLFFGGPLARFRLSSQFIHGFVKNIPRVIDEIKSRLRSTC